MLCAASAQTYHEEKIGYFHSKFIQNKKRVFDTLFSSFDAPQ